MRATAMITFVTALLFTADCGYVRAAMSEDGALSSTEKLAIEKQKKIIDEMMDLYATRALDRPVDFTACMREMLAMNRSKKCRDKFTHYNTPEIAKQQKDDYTGHFGGVGMELTEEDGVVIIMTPMAGTPSERVGLRAKDIILNVGGLVPEDVNEAVSLIRGKVGTNVTITIFRPETKQKLDFTLTREVINIQTVKWRVSSTDPKVGIVEIRKFDETVPLKFAEAVIALAKKNAPNIVIDVRNNPGGLVDSVTSMLSLFAQEKDLLLSIRYRDKESVVTFPSNLGLFARINYAKTVVMLARALDIDSLKNINTVLLINGGSASASEILAGTMKDWGYPIVGEKSYGKGVGQEVFTLSDNSTFMLTTFEFLVGNHKIAIRDKGVAPTIEVKMPEIQDKKDKKEKLSDREKEKADPQLLKAIEVLEACRQTGTVPLHKCTRN